MLNKHKKDELEERALTGIKFQSYTDGYISIKANDILELLKEINELKGQVEHFNKVKEERDKYFVILRASGLLPY